MKPKPWQTAIIVLGLLVGGGLTVYSLSSGGEVDIPDAYYLIDVESGQIYRANLSSNRVAIPAAHPETGRVTLIGASRSDDGKFFVSPRDLTMIANLDKNITVKAIDVKSGELTVPAGKPVDYPRTK